MSKQRNPYLGRPDYQFWKSAPGRASRSEFDPVTSVSFQIRPEERIVTAGSCFAQHVARHLTKSGFTHHVTEPGHPHISKEARDVFNYGVFSARYGNIYTAKQLRQLLDRAYGLFSPIEQSWDVLRGRGVVDPFRPLIQPKGFINEAELAADRRQHFEAVRRAIEEMDVLVFTLGLTESWMDRRDGAVFPLAPGVAGGFYDQEKFAFHNMTVTETVEDMNAAFDIIRKRNPKARFIVTVSPVPLNATALNRHVAVSTVYSKSILRIAAEEICSAWKTADYFPSFEIITSSAARSANFAEDGRTVTESGVEHVMRIFLKHYAVDTKDTVAEDISPVDSHNAEMERIFRAICDEEAISNK